MFVGYFFRKFKNIRINFINCIFFCCRYLIKFLFKLVEKFDENKMIFSNIVIVIGLNFFWLEGDNG